MKEFFNAPQMPKPEKEFSEQTKAVQKKHHEFEDGEFISNEAHENDKLAEIAAMMSEEKINPKEIIKMEANELNELRDEFLDALKYNGSLGRKFEHKRKEYYPEEVIREYFSNDKTVMTKVVEAAPYLFDLASRELRSQKDFALMGVERDPRNITELSKELMLDKDIMLEAAKKEEHINVYVGGIQEAANKDLDIIVQCLKTAERKGTPLEEIYERADDKIKEKVKQLLQLDKK